MDSRSPRDPLMPGVAASRWHCALRLPHGWASLDGNASGERLGALRLTAQRSAVSGVPPAWVAELRTSLCRPMNWQDSQRWLRHCDLEQLSAFRRQVLLCLAESVGPGQTITYGALAQRCQRPRAQRAVAQALRWNPFPLLIPCHRCLAARGLGGFMGNVPGAQERKKALLVWEQG